MKSGLIVLAALALTPAAVFADEGGHQGMMPGTMHGMHGMTASGHDGNDPHDAPDDAHAGGSGEPGNPRYVSRTIRVVMSDEMKFTPANIAVRRGETVRFALSNVGQLKHEMVIGSAAELKEHAEMMRKMPGMEHADPNIATIPPGGTAELIWRFTKPGTVDFACLQPGHFEAGMMGAVSVK